MNYSGNKIGPAIDSVQDVFREKCRIEEMEFRQVFLAAEIVGADANSFNVYVGAYNYSEEKLYRVYVVEIDGSLNAGQIVEISIDSMKTDIISERVDYNEVIDSAEDFFEAYPGGVIEGTAADYLTNGCGEELNENALNDKSGVYSDLFVPELAAAQLLNVDLSKEGGKVYTIMDTDSSGVTVCFEFAKTGMCAYVKMIKPFGGEGIWIPQSDEIN